MHICSTWISSSCTDYPKTSWSWARKLLQEANPNTNSEWCRWKMWKIWTHFKDSAVFSAAFHHLCQQLIGFHNRWQRLWDPNANITQWAHGLCHKITFRISGLRMFSEHESPLKGCLFGSPLSVSVEATTSVYPSGRSLATCRIYSRRKNRKTASQHKDLSDVNNLLYTRHKLMPFLDQWVTLAPSPQRPRLD